MRGERFLRWCEAWFLRADRAIHAAVPDSLNPLTQAGAIANLCLIVALASGALLLIWWSASVHGAYSSLESLRRGSFVGQFMRSVHRYSSDACMFFVLLHAFRMFFARRFGGPRWLAWATGILLVGFLWVVGWLGYWLVWDQRAQQVAVGTARMLDVIPVFGDPPSRSLLTDRGVSSLLFFIVFFMHMLLPLGMAVFLYIHITRLSRSKFLTRTPMTVLVSVTLAVMSIALPATSAARASMTVVPGAFRFDAWYLLPLALTDRLSAGALWAFALLNGALLTAVPWMLVRRRATPAVVEPSKCNECRKCYEDCPYQAISMVPRTDGKAFATVAFVDDSKCVGCGVCAGSCDSAGVGLPWLDVPSERKRLDAWIDDACATGLAPHIAFVCAESGGGGLDVDASTGVCRELEGYRVFPIPCTGWVHMLSVERALRHGAAGVLFVACGPGDCRYREGAAWTDQRIRGERAPSLRRDKIDSERVRQVYFDRTARARFLAEARGFRQHTALSCRSASRSRALGTGAMLAVILAGSTLAVANVPYAGPPQERPTLVVSFKHPGVGGEHCREVSAEENARVPAHMRRDRICERGRSPVRLRVYVDGALVHTRAYAAGGLRHDEPSTVLERIAVPSGEHDVRVDIGESRDAREWTFHFACRTRFDGGRRRVILFDRSSGFTLD